MATNTGAQLVTQLMEVPNTFLTDTEIGVLAEGAFVEANEILNDSAYRAVRDVDHNCTAAYVGFDFNAWKERCHNELVGSTRRCAKVLFTHFSTSVPASVLAAYDIEDLPACIDLFECFLRNNEAPYTVYITATEPVSYSLKCTEADPAPNPWRTWTTQEEVKMMALSRAGNTPQQIGDLLFRTKQSIRARIRLVSHRKPSNRKRVHEDDDSGPLELLCDEAISSSAAQCMADWHRLKKEQREAEERIVSAEAAIQSSKQALEKISEQKNMVRQEWNRFLEE